MKIRQLEKLFVVVLAVLCCGLGAQLRLSLKENGKGTVVYKKKVTTEEPAPLPEAYDLRQKQKEPEVKNQGTLGTCWAVAASSALERRRFYLPEQLGNRIWRGWNFLCFL